MYSTKLLLLILTTVSLWRSLPPPNQAPSLADSFFFFSTLNKAPLYLVCVPNKVKGELSDVNIQFFLCVTEELIKKDKRDLVGERISCWRAEERVFERVWERPRNEVLNPPRYRHTVTGGVGLHLIEIPGKRRGGTGQLVGMAGPWRKQKNKNKINT